MKKLAKKIMIYSMVGIMQVGLGATIVAASPLYNENSQRVVQLDNRDENHNDRQREHDRRQREENQRHEREMQRQQHENDREWHERQDRENQRHNDANDEIGAFLLGVIFGSIIN